VQEIVRAQTLLYCIDLDRCCCGGGDRCHHEDERHGRPQSSVVARKSAGLLALKAPKRDIAGLDEPGNLLAPVSDADVFDTNERCLVPEKALQRLEADRDAIGGKVVMLADGLQQSYSDTWRLKAHVAPVRVSSVVAHLFSDASGSKWNADVIEFDADGCAMSRTLVPARSGTDFLRAPLAAGSRLFLGTAALVTAMAGQG
jgi:hypothetical protein